MSIIILPPAREKARDAKKYYNQQREGLGDEFLDAVNEAVRRVERFPNAWSRLSQRTRRCRTKRFLYGIVYAQCGTDIVILAVMHLRRKPGYWRDRFKDLPE